MNDGGKSGRDMQQRIAQLEFGLRNILKLAHASNVHLHQFATNQDKERNISQLRAAAEANARILEYNSELNLSASYDRNRKRLASLFQHMINGFTYCRSIRNKNGEIIDLRFIEANTAFYKIMGKKPEEILNRGFRETFPAPGACDSILNAIKKLDRHGGAIETEEHFAPLDKWLMLSAFSTDKDYFALLLYDITSKKKAEDRLSAALVRATKANKDKDHFLATLSHDIRTPLSTIHNVAELLGGSARDEESQKHSQLISASCNHLLLMIDEILDAYSADKGGVKLGERTFSPAESINSYLEGMRQTAEQKGISLNLFIDPDMPDALCGDHAKFGRVFYNIIGNAIKFTSSGGVQVSVTRIASGSSDDPNKCRLLLEVRDTGAGIPEESLDSIFEPYAKAASLEQNSMVGSGLGLSITSDIIKKMGGEICVESEPGKGSTFYCLLPLEKAESACGQDKSKQLRAFLNTLSLLVVDDNELHADTTAQLLGSFVGRAQTAYSGEEAFAVLKNDDVNMILLDLSLPDMTGFSFTKRIRKGLVPGCPKDIYIVALTGHTLPEHRDQCLAAGMNAFMVKPFSKTVFLNMLRPLFMRRVQDATAPTNKPQNQFAPDHDALKKEYAGHESMITDLLARFLKSHVKPMKELDRAVADSDLDQVRDRAHYIKTSFLTIQAAGCASIAGELEMAAKQGDAKKVKSLHDSLSQGLRQCIENIEGRLKE